MRTSSVSVLLGIAIAGGATAIPHAALAQDEKPAEMVWVHLEDDGVRLEVEEDSAHDEWATVCSAPCDMQVSSDFYYRLRGGGHKASPKFTLRAANGEHDHLEARGGSVPMTIFGGIVTGLGAGVLLVALDNILGGPIVGPAYSASIYGPSSSLQDEEKGGLILLAIGLPVTIGGYLILRANRTTTVTQEIVPAPPPPQAWLRSLDAKESARRCEPAPPLVSVPIYMGVF